MRSNLCRLPHQGGCMDLVFKEVEKCAVYNGLTPRQTLQLRLLAEELTSMLPALLKDSDGIFWIDCEDKHFELRVALSAVFFGVGQRNRVLKVASSGKNAAAVGIMGKIRAAAESAMLFVSSAGPASSMSPSLDALSTLPGPFVTEWDLAQYRQQVIDQQQAEQWDELEKSIVGKLADDVTVSIKGERVEIAVKKSFE